MDDLMLDSSNTKPNLLSLKGKDWSSLQNLDSEDSEETNSEQAFHQNGYLNLNRIHTNCLVNGVPEFTTTNSIQSSDDSSLPIRNHDTMKLNKEDMSIYGLRPAYDQFYLVVCEHCGKVFKPQALSKHIEQRHSNDENPIDNLRQVRSEESSSLTEDDFNINRTDNNNHNLRTLLSSTSSSLILANSTSKDDLDLEKLKDKQSLLSSKSNSSSNSTSASPLNLPSLSENLSVKKLTKPKLLPCKDRKYDADKHCGVKSNENDKPCTRSLTCKTHSLTLRRSVQGRSDSFDNLLNDHRLAKEAAMRAAGFEVKPTKLQLKQQQRMQKNNQLLIKEQQRQESLKEQTNSNSSSFSNQSTNQFKIHLQPLNSPSSSLSTSPSFKAFNQFHHQNQQESSSILSNNKTISNLNTALQSPTSGNSSFVNINNLQFSSPTSSNFKQFTLGNNQQLGKLLSSPSRTSSSFNSSNVTTNQSQTGILSSSSLQVINQSKSLNNNNYVTNFEPTNKNYSSSTLINSSRPFICDISPTATINHYPKPAALCTFNERRLSIFTQSNKQILSSKLFNRKQDLLYSALMSLRNCNKEKILNDTNESIESNGTPTKHIKSNNKIKTNNSVLSNSQSNSRTDFYSGNSQESCSPFDCNGLSSPSLSRKSSSDFVINDHSITKSYLSSNGFNRSTSIVVNDKDSEKSQFNNVNTNRMNYF